MQKSNGVIGPEAIEGNQLMRPLPVYVWRKLQMAVMQLHGHSSVRDILGVLVLWLRESHQYLDAEPFSTYGINEFSLVDESSMPIEFSSFVLNDLTHVKKAILTYLPKDVESIARFLRDTLESLITVELDKQCPNCQSDGVRVFIGKQSGRPVFQCGICGRSHYTDGSKVQEALDFANEKKLRELKMI